MYALIEFFDHLRSDRVSRLRFYFEGLGNQFFGTMRRVPFNVCEIIEISSFVTAVVSPVAYRRNRWLTSGAHVDCLVVDPMNCIAVWSLCFESKASLSTAVADIFLENLNSEFATHLCAPFVSHGTMKLHKSI